MGEYVSRRQAAGVSCTLHDNQFDCPFNGIEILAFNVYLIDRGQKRQNGGKKAQKNKRSAKVKLQTLRMGIKGRP